MRYRTNGCDHATAVQRVMAQIDGNPAGQVCGAPPDGLIAFPPRTDSLNFRQQLETKYQSFNRGASSSTVDAEGGVVWTQEYLRYRVNSCDHPTAVQKVFSQIDGGGVSPTCFVPPCIFTVTPTTQTIPAAGGTFTADRHQDLGRLHLRGGKPRLVRDARERNQRHRRDDDTDVQGRPKHRGCEEHADSRPLDQQLDAARDQPGGVHRRVHHDRSAKQRESDDHLFDQNGGDAVRVYGDGARDGDRNVSRGPSATSTARLVSHNQSGSSPTFTFTQTCGGPGSTVGGTETTLNVTLTVTDANGTTTVQSGSGSQPPLIIKFFTC